MTTEQQGLADGEVICLANLHLATEQQVFDQVATHLLTQAARSHDSDNCRYRFVKQVNQTTGDVVTLKCAAGCLIADDEYDADVMEGYTWYKIGEGKPHKSLVCKLQKIHDKTPPSSWAIELRMAANTARLNCDVVDKLCAASDAVAAKTHGVASTDESGAQAPDGQ